MFAIPVTDERASKIEYVALLDQFVALGLTRHFCVIVIDKVEQELNVTFQHRQVDWKNGVRHVRSWTSHFNTVRSTERMVLDM